MWSRSARPAHPCLVAPEDVLNQGPTPPSPVPHFVFSGFHAERAELNILIVDDPSQSFDTTHVELLLLELRPPRARQLSSTHEETGSPDRGAPVPLTR